MRRLFAIPLFAIMIIALALGCGNEVSTNSGTGDGSQQPGASGWLIPEDEVFDGGPGRDGIPALSNPLLVKASEASYINPGDLVIGIKLGDDMRAYPHPILDWHEIINHGTSEVPYAITYCPLTGSGMAWNRFVNGSLTTFGVSGMLYNSNLIPYDRATGSNWSQMLLQCVKGTLSGTTPIMLPVVETTWHSWKTMYPETKVVSTTTGYNRPYGDYPYEDYRTNHNWLLFPVANDDDRLPRKQRVLGVITEAEVQVYQLTSFGFGTNVINDEVGGVPIVAVGNQTGKFAVAFERTLADGTVLSFSPADDALPRAMVDDEGTIWDIFGNAVSGPRIGKQLTPATSYMAFWFAWAAFYPEVAIYGR